MRQIINLNPEGEGIYTRDFQNLLNFINKKFSNEGEN